MKTTVYIATSLDGFIAREDGRLDWLPGADGKPSDSAEDYGYAHFFNSIDAILMGRHTFETVLSFGDWPYTKPVIVLSTALSPKTTTPPEEVRLMAGSPAAILEQLAADGFQHLYIDGGKTIQQFLRAGKVDELIITRIPVLIGSGLPLFGALDSDVQLMHLKTAAFPSGFVQSHYRIAS